MTTTNNNLIAEMTRALVYAGPTFSGGDEASAAGIAEEWVDAGFSVQQAERWWDAGAFDAARAAELRDADISPRDVKADCPDLPGYSWGYAHSNADVSLEDVRAMIEV